MAIEIKELIVKTTVHGNFQEKGSVTQEQLKQIKNEIVGECTNYIKTVLKEQKER